MKFRKIMPFALALVVCVSAARAQEQPQDNAPQAPIPPVPPDQTGDEGNRQVPAPAGRGIFSVNDSEPSEAPIGPDTHSLTGAEAFGLGSPTGSHNSFDPALHTYVGGDTGITTGTTNVVASIGGSLALNHSKGRYQTTVLYAGAGIFYHPASFDNTQYHDLSFTQAIRGRRTVLQLRDDFIDSPGATFGGLNTGGFGLTTSSGSANNLAPNFQPGQSILTGNSNSLANTALAEVDYALTRRSTLTFVGSYQLLHFLDVGFIDSRTADGRVGYSYELDRKNSIGFSYDYNRANFSGTNGTVANNTLQASYGRKITGRLAFQVSGGVIAISQPNSGAPNTWRWSWSSYSALTYQVRHTTYSVNYSHLVTNGSGVFLGAQSHTISGSAQTVIFRSWTPSVSGGYALDTNLVATGANSSHYGTWYGGASLGRLWDHFLQTSAIYGIQGQGTNVASCPVLNCGSATSRQVFGVTLDIHFRPVGVLR